MSIGHAREPRIAGRRAAARRRAAGFTLIELLIVVAIIGIIAAIAVPNLLNAIDKGKQKRTMADLRSIGTAVEAYAVDTAKFPAGAADWNALKALINPYFIKDPPGTDGWNTVWDTVTDANGTDYTLASYGKDGLLGSRTGGQTVSFNCDIVFSEGRFFQWPEGTQT
jgi:general secretion pathway protein G